MPIVYFSAFKVLFSIVMTQEKEEEGIRFERNRVDGMMMKLKGVSHYSVS